jgi:hypothetical protein
MASTILYYLYIFVFILNLYINTIREDEPERYQQIKKKCREIINNLIYNLIYTYSKCQIVYAKVYSFIILKANENGLLIRSVRNEICQITYSKISVQNFTDDKDIYFEHTDDSLYIFSDYKNANGKKSVNKIISHTQQFNTNYETSNIKFILIEVKVNDNIFKVDLKTDDYNYYVVGNILDKKFFIYYLHCYNLCNLSKDEADKLDKLNVKLIDHNVNIHNLEITDKNYILLEKNNYIYTKE